MTMGLNPISARVISGKPRRSQRALSQTATRMRSPIAAPKDAQRTVAYGSGNAREEAENNKEQGRERIE